MFVKRNVLLEKVLLIFLLVMCFTFILFNYYPRVLICFLILLIEFIMLFKVKKNNLLLFIYLCFFYFDYSVIFGKYIGTPINRLSIVYSQIPMSSNIHSIGLMSLLLFHIVVLLFLPKIKNSAKDTFSNSFFSNNISLVLVTIFTFIIVVGYIFLPSVIDSRALYEYAIILFCIGFYISKQNAICHYILIFLMSISTIVNMYHGGRIISLLPMIAFFIIYIINKIKANKLIVSFVLVVIIFTFFGLYGDLIEANSSSRKVPLSDLKSTMLERKFTLDTAVSSFWTGLTFIGSSSKYSTTTRIQNGLQYLTSYTLLGSKSNYEQIYYIAKKHYTHYYGGYIQSYFYYWFGYFGVIIISIYVSFFIRMINNLDKNTSDYKKILSIYILATLPRWYLYYPTSLFRGVLIFSIVYLVFFKFFKLQTHNSKK